MKEFRFGDKKVVFKNADNVQESYAKETLEYAEQQKQDESNIIDTVTVVMLDDHNADVTISFVQNKEEINRIRRITGYLSTSLSSWNDAKKAEERERVKHI